MITTAYSIADQLPTGGIDRRPVIVSNRPDCVSKPPHSCTEGVPLMYCGQPRLRPPFALSLSKGAIRAQSVSAVPMR